MAAAVAPKAVVLYPHQARRRRHCFPLGPIALHLLEKSPCAVEKVRRVIP